MEQQDVRAAWARLVAVAVSSVCGLYLLLVLGLGAVWVTMDWCFDGDEPACTDPAPAEAGLATVQASSWTLGSVAVIATLGAIMLARRVRRVAHVVAVLALCATSVVIARVLWERV